MIETRIVALTQMKQMGVVGPQGQVQLMLGPRESKDVNAEIEHYESEGFQVVPNTMQEVRQFNPGFIIMYRDPISKSHFEGQDREGGSEHVG